MMILLRVLPDQFLLQLRRLVAGSLFLHKSTMTLRCHGTEHEGCDHPTFFFVCSSAFQLSFLLSKSHLTALSDDNILCWFALRIGYRPGVLDFGDNVHALDDIAEDYVLAVQVGSAGL